LEYGDLMRKVEETYKRFIDMGMAKEQARIILPLSQSYNPAIVLNNVVFLTRVEILFNATIKSIIISHDIF